MTTNGLTYIDDFTLIKKVSICIINWKHLHEIDLLGGGKKCIAHTILHGFLSLSCQQMCLKVRVNMVKKEFFFFHLCKFLLFSPWTTNRFSTKTKQFPLTAGTIPANPACLLAKGLAEQLAPVPLPETADSNSYKISVVNLLHKYVLMANEFCKCYPHLSRMEEEEQQLCEVSCFERIPAPWKVSSQMCRTYSSCSNIP